MARYAYVFWGILLLMLLCGCEGRNTTAKEGSYDVYYMNLNETALVKDAYEAVADQPDMLILELLQVMKTEPAQAEYFVLLNDSIQVDDYHYDGSNVELNMSEEYGILPRTKEVLIRAGLVRTLVQIDGVETVSFLVNGAPLYDSKGQPIGRLTAQSFIENSGKQINTFKNDTLTLYFTNETGTALISEKRKLYYSSNVSLEQVVVEQLLKGPKTEGSFPTLPGSTNIMSVTVVDKNCYVNFDATFSDGALNVQEQIPIYSIANSIIENCNVNQVQISINGESDRIFRESMNLSEFYQMNRDLILEVTP